MATTVDFFYEGKPVGQWDQPQTALKLVHHDDGKGCWLTLKDKEEDFSGLDIFFNDRNALLEFHARLSEKLFRNICDCNKCIGPSTEEEELIPQEGTHGGV